MVHRPKYKVNETDFWNPVCVFVCVCVCVYIRLLIEIYLKSSLPKEE